MKLTQTQGRIIGLLFLIPLLTYGIGSGLMAAVIDSPATMHTIAENKAKLITGGMLVLANSMTVVLIGIMLYPLLENYSRRIAVGYLSTRILESLLLLIGLIGLLTLIPLSAHATAFENNYVLIREIQFLSYQLAMIVLGSGSIFFCLVLYQFRLIPRLVSLLGVTGYTLLAFGALAELYGCKIGILLSIPGGIFEITIGVWLLIKGFNVSKTTSMG